MRPLSATLGAAVSAPGRQPAISVLLEDWAQRYAMIRDDHAATPDAPSAAVVAADGSLVRAYVSLSAGSSDSSLYVQRVTDPAQSGQWTAWTLLDSGDVFGSCPPALSLNPGGVLRLFFVDGPSGGTTVRVHQSTDNGATWSAAATVLSGTVTAGGLASAGNDDLFLAAQPAVGSWQVCYVHCTAGTWSAPSVWTLGSFSLMSGLAALWSGSGYLLVLSVWATSGLSLNAYGFDGAGTWTGLGTVVPLDTGNLGLEMRFPSLAWFDGLYRLAYVEHDNGASDGNVCDRVRLCSSPDFLHWTDGPPVGGQQMTHSPTWLKWAASYYVLNCGYVFAWPVYAAGDVTRCTDVSGQVLAFERHERPLKASQLRLVISNENGQFNAASGLTRNGRVTLQEGYVTAAGIELVTVGHYYLDHWFYQRSPGENELVLLASDATKWLDREAGRQWVYANQTLGWLITELAIKAGILHVSIPATVQFGEVVARFVVNPGETWRAALHRLIELYGAEYLLDSSEQLVVREPNAGDAAVWSFGPEIQTAQWGAADEAANHVRVFGSGVQSEVWDFSNLSTVGQERYRHVVDRQLTTIAQCQLRASLELALEQRKAAGGILEGPLHPGLELFDVVSVTDAAAGLADQHYRLQGLKAVMNVLRGEYEMRLELSGV